MSTVKKVAIKDLSHDASNTIIVAIVISTQKVRCFPSRQIANTTNGVFNLTVRDSPTDYINVTFWGSEETTRKLERTIKVGDIVNICNAHIQLRDNTRNINDDLYRPSVTSPFLLTLNEMENYCSLTIHEDDDYCSSCLNLKTFLAFPTKPISGFRALKDLQANVSLVHGEIVDLLVAVKSISGIKAFKSKTSNNPVIKRELIVFDQSFPKLLITIWDSELIYRSENWLPRKTLLFIADIRIEWSQFNKCVVGTIISKTIITENPIKSPEVIRLREFADKAPMDVTEFLNQLNNINIESIINVVSVQKILDKIDKFAEDMTQNFTGIVYGIMTAFNLDQAIVLECGVCKNKLSEEFKMCVNLNCPVGNGSEADQSRAIFNVRIDISDHTGTVQKCRITPKSIEQMLKMTADRFKNLPEPEQIKMKWTYLLERCEFRIVITPSINLTRKPIITIVDCKLISYKNVLDTIPQY